MLFLSAGHSLQAERAEKWQKCGAWYSKLAFEAEEANSQNWEMMCL